MYDVQNICEKYWLLKGRGGGFDRSEHGHVLEYISSGGVLAIAYLKKGITKYVIGCDVHTIYGNNW